MAVSCDLLDEDDDDDTAVELAAVVDGILATGDDDLYSL